MRASVSPGAHRGPLVAAQRPSRSIACVPHATASNSSSTTTAAPPGNPLLLKAVEALFQFPPIFRAAAKAARRKIVDRGVELGLDFAGEIQALRNAVDWDAEIAAATDPSVTMPSYYRAPFHAYESGNLSLDAALEVTAAARSVHATVMDPEGKRVDPEGDTNLRASYHRCMQQLLESSGARPVSDILDIGAATGLSSLALLADFPGSRVTALDLSPHFLAAGRVLQRQRNGYVHTNTQEEQEPLTFIHRAAESTGLPDASFDLVSLCLVCHELPQEPTRAILAEALRVLRPGGAVAIMDMNPRSSAFQKVMSNPVPYVVFKSTEPYLLDYMKFHFFEELERIGYVHPQQLENSPRHRTLVAIKPQ